MAFLKLTKAMNALVEETSFAVVDKLMAFLDTRIEMDEDMKGLFDEFKEQLTGELKETAKAVTKGGKAAKKAPGEKRAPSAYNLFIKDKMAELKEEDPEMSAKDRMKAATALWREHKEALAAEAGEEAPKPKAAKGAKKAAKGSASDAEEPEDADEEPKPKAAAKKGGAKGAKKAAKGSASDAEEEPKPKKGGKGAKKAAAKETVDEEEPTEE